MLKKKYSRSTLDSARLYAETKGWKKLSKKRVQSFLDNVKNATGYITPNSIKNYAELSYSVSDSENKRYKEATYRWAQANRPDWDNITQNRIDEFKNEFTAWAIENGYDFINSELALDFANQSLNPSDVEQLDETFFDDRNYFTRSMAGWSDPDVVDSFINLPNFIQATIIDVDQSVLFIGTERKDFWDVFRDLTTGNVFPIYDAYYQQDKYGNVFVTIQITGYYP
jgi:hypothetical protein